MTSINDKIAADKAELVDALANHDEGKTRHLLNELADLDNFKKNHPDQEEAPSYLELYCDANPSEPECLIYDD